MVNTGIFQLNVKLEDLRFAKNFSRKELGLPFYGIVSSFNEFHEFRLIVSNGNS